MYVHKNKLSLNPNDCTFTEFLSGFMNFFSEEPCGNLLPGALRYPPHTKH